MTSLSSREARDRRHNALHDALDDAIRSGFVANISRAARERVAEEDFEALLDAVVETLDEHGVSLCDGQDHHQTHGNGPVSAEERQSGLGDDGLTDEERQEFLSEFQRGIGSKRINDGATGAERGEG